ncbi:four-carbon acid sugar kinase family protein [Jiangella alba]|uniref:Uncharacterized conserved protein YgbK, DUF1537 family n=1 Tax=Jiangella alba TaxID=561176 RepID=A0A1H5JNI1_9ACTN|nr:four-carbon acid sugar kinase family protein [Jiangella alba]SEE54143.1 Uncharacterized conserved protein YgbK, DUF1537 family [Jiangella alba]
MTSPAVTLAELDRPPTARREADDLAAVRAAAARRRTWTVVIDDDPTGTQCVRDVPVVMGEWTAGDLAWAARGHDLAFVLTNSRALPASEASRVTSHAAAAAGRAGERLGRPVRYVSRSDSTLRGHVREEVAAVRAAAGSPQRQRVVFAPAFVEAGRVTARGVQWVGDGVFVPAAATEYAADPAFGYDDVDLAAWVRARLRDDVARVRVLDLALLRGGSGPELVRDELRRGHHDDVWIAEAVTGGDLAALAAGCALAEDDGLRVVYRTGPTAVRALAGRPLPEPWPGRDGPAASGLVVVGSHTGLTNVQVDELRRSRPVSLVELDARVVAAVDEAAREAEIGRAAAAVRAAVPSVTTVLRTSRQVVAGADPITTSGRVAAALTETVRRIAETTELGFLVAKGGITSHDVPARALGATRAVVLGQLFPGMVPVWRLLDGSRPELPYVVFPGNVGDRTSLAVTVTRLAEGDRSA